MAVEIKYNIVEAHYRIDELERQCALFEEGLRDYAESKWRESSYMGREPNKSLDQFIDDAVKDYTIEKEDNPVTVMVSRLNSGVGNIGMP